MKHKLRNQIALTFIGMVMLSLLTIGIINGFFLEEYYLAQKSQVLKEVFDDLQDYDLSSGEVSDELMVIASENNLNWVVTDPLNQQFSVVSQGKDEKRLAAQLFGYETNIEDEDNHEIVDDCWDKNHYKVQKTHDRFAGMDYLELWGKLDNGNSCLIRSPLESIRESADISNRFFVYVGLIIVIISAAIIWLLTNHLTKPISELTVISKEMAGLNFETRYNSRSRNEIDILGENFNSMSEQLKNTITELKQANFELEKDIADKIEIDNKRKEFLDNVSHELKTPIALVQGYAEGLKDNISDDPESMEFYCDVIIDEAGKMNRMVKQLLNLNQLESGQDAADIERFDIVALVQGVIAKSSILIQQNDAHVQFEPDEPVYVWADEFKIEEVVTNFFTNALNHLDGKRVIDIKIRRDGDKAHVSVFNTGQPIPEEDIDQIWNKFYKVDKARTREYGGSGIGLSIVKAIMESHHQQCGVKNYDNGVEFWFELNCD